MCWFLSIFVYIQIDMVLRNETSRAIQPEVIYRSDSLGQTSSNTIAGASSGIERKGSVAIGQSIFYTEDPPQDFPNSGKSVLISNPFIKWTAYTKAVYCIREWSLVFY